MEQYHGNVKTWDKIQVADKYDLLYIYSRLENTFNKIQLIFIPSLDNWYAIIIIIFMLNILNKTIRIESTIFLHKT